jgi:hypothetical protein
MTPIGNERANAVSEREPNNETDCEGNFDAQRHAAITSDHEVWFRGLRSRGVELQRAAAERAQNLRTVFAELSDLSARKAAEELNRRGIPTAAGGKWHAMQVFG